MSTAEVAKKKGRPRKTVAETIAIVEEQPALIEAKSPRVSRKSTTSPNEKLNDFASAGAQVVTKHETLPSSPKIVKEPKTRPAKSVAAETVILASRQVKAPSTRPEPSLIFKQATAFVETQKDKLSPEPLEPVKVDPQIRPKEFKPAGTLPAVGLPGASTQAVKPSASSQTKTSSFLTDFFTQPALAEQPAWSRPKKSSTISASSSMSRELDTAPEPATPQRPNTSALLSASPLPTISKTSIQSPPVIQLPRKRAASVEARSETSPRSSTQPLKQPGTPSPAAVSPTRQAAMPANPSTEARAPPSQVVRPPSTKPTTLPRLPPRAAAATTAPLKPTELPYEVLKRDPKFKALSRRYTALIVSIPILLATSYALYGRYTETTVQRKRVVDQGTRTINGGV